MAIMQLRALILDVLDDVIELLSSMRFAISLLTVLAIAAVIGTVIEQGQPVNDYLNQFGQFWDPVFTLLNLYTVYSAGWFVSILGFLVLSTTLCIIRQSVPKVREMRGFREHAREVSLMNFALHASMVAALTRKECHDAATAYLTREGFQLRTNEREDATLIAAKKGHWGHLGYFLAHGAIVLICLGGLLDGNLPFSLYLLTHDKTPVSGNMTFSEVPQSARLDPDNWSYRGEVSLREGDTTDYAVLFANKGFLLQALPFSIKLNRFHVDYYPTGMPRKYASEVEIIDLQSGERMARTIEVNKPLQYKGVTLFQSGFNDGGSRLRLTLHSLSASKHTSVPLSAEIGARIPLTPFTLELTDFKPANVENVGEADPVAFTGSGAPSSRSASNMRNLGPSLVYRLRDSAGQAQEYFNYMQPVTFFGVRYLISGMRASQKDDYTWLKIPLDADDSPQTWLEIRRLLFDPARQPEIINRYLSRSFKGNTEVADDLLKNIRIFVENSLNVFTQGNMEAVMRFINSKVPEDKRKEELDKTITFFYMTLQGLIWESWTMTLEASGKEVPKTLSESQSLFVRDTLEALSQSQHYNSPFYLQLDSFEHRQASILQASRSPGKNLVYLGSFLLALGVFVMLYVRERKLFLLLKDNEALLAMSSERKSIDMNEAFARHRNELAALLAPATIKRI